MATTVPAATEARTIDLTIDGREVSVPEGTTIWEAAKEAGIEIPVLCHDCVRAGDDIQGNDVIGRSGKGYATRIAFDLNDPMGESSCVTCGECVAACPTGALVNKPIRDVPIRPRSELDQVETVCPYC